MFNKRQAGKDQCNQDSATAKRQMNYYIEGGKNIETAEEINEALRSATALCGFNSMVMDIQEKKSYEKEKNINDVSKIHHIKYVTNKTKKMFHVWQYYGIGKGKLYKVGKEPLSPKHLTKIPFKQQHLSTGKACPNNKKEIVYCSEPMCVKSFSSVDLMLKHLDLGQHEYQATKSSQLVKIKDKWVERFVNGGSTDVSGSCQDVSTTFDGNLPGPEKMGWAIPKRAFQRLTEAQMTFLNKLFDESERKASKVTPEAALVKMKETFEVKDYLPVATIKSYFSRRARKIKSGKITTGEINNDEDTTEDADDIDVDENTDENADEDDKVHNKRQKATAIIQHQVNDVSNLLADDWVAVDFPRGWYPGQFIRHDEDNGKIYVNFLEKTSSNAKTFTWPVLSFKKEDKCWVAEEDVIYRLAPLNPGPRNTLTFVRFEYVNCSFAEWKQSLKERKI